MKRQGQTAKMEKVFLRNAILDKERYGYQVVADQSEYEEGYRAPGQDDGPEAEVFSELELRALYGEAYTGPFNQEDVAPEIGNFVLPTFSKGEIIKGIVVG
jgi:hypothetical protein